MPILEDAKRALERLTGYRRPKRRELDTLLRARTPRTFKFKNDGRTPNNPAPVILYRTPVSLPARFDPAAVFEELFAAHGWRDSWRNGMYDYLHFHTRTHEVLGIARGRLRAEFGGSAGKTVELKAGDVAVLPAGTGHRRISASRDLLVVGAYPAKGTYDEPEPGEVEISRAARDISRVPTPPQDPVYGKTGPLVQLWRAVKQANARKPLTRRATRKTAGRGNAKRKGR
jgi:uncharacterized protein YjlB